MDIKVIYTRNFSKIENIQDHERIYYNLIIQVDENNNKIYGIELVSSKEDQLENQTIEGVSDNEDLVLNIINYLYENAIKPGEFIGIVSDLLNEIL